ncbi:MAG: DNA-protecting protein DprA [Actinobacteria bacterium]|uniref:Unannotated protein n=1 Tax=freshwater metagenome TaxID=449393 RepID=A0A6J5ZL22_9ZZZZ|nr:DNA-protecting protein DprA [Actinomycetota bacterium]
MSDACDQCTRRSWLVGRLSGHLETIRGDRPAVRCVLALSDEQLVAAVGGRERGRIEAQWKAFNPALERSRWERCGARAICLHSSDYPLRLHELPDPPAVLHFVGTIERFRLLVNGSPLVAIVGSRRASSDGLDLACELGRQLSLCGVTVVSGMALGIDSAVHEGALSTGARTVAVLACGPERPYPARRRQMHGQLREAAVVVSELPPGSSPYRWAFPARNRVIAAITSMTVVVEAAERSGSLITAEIAADLGRTVGAVPGSPSSWHSAGANALLRDGANFVRDARDVLDDLLGAGFADSTSRSQEQDRSRMEEGFSEAQLSVLEAIARGARTAAAVSEQCSTLDDAIVPLTELELAGVLSRRDDGSYRRR